VFGLMTISRVALVAPVFVVVWCGQRYHSNVQASACQHRRCSRFGARRHRVNDERVLLCEDDGVW
jgi:hypothetical protein